MDSNLYISCDINNFYRLLLKCNSYLLVKFIGKIVKILLEKLGIIIFDLNDKFELLVIRNYWDSCDFDECSRIVNFKLDLYDKENVFFMKVVDVVRDCLDIEDNNEKFFKGSFFNKEIGLVYDNCFNLLKKLEYRFDIKFNYMDILKYDLVLIYILIELVERYKNL